uniref:beta strand repeat-containing protein n=1 Tax=Zoogloea sp. TaxID=49181 RepID=UPI0035AE78E3
SLLATTTGALASSVGTTGDVTYHAGGALVFGTSSIGGNLNATAAGPISQTGALDVTGTATVDAGSKAVTLAEANRVGGLFSVTTTGPANLSGYFGSLNTHTGALSLGATTVDSNAAITASGPISQTAALVVGGTTTLDAGANAITLGNAGNDFGGAVSAVGGTTALRDANALDVALHTGAATLDAASLSASGTASSLLATTTGALASSVGTTGDVTYHAGGALVFGTSSIGGNLNATAAGPISQTGALDVTGTATVDAGSQAVTLAEANRVGGLFSVTTTGPANLSGYFGSLNTHTGALSLGATTVDSNAAITASGPISQTAALVVGGTTTLDAGANAITLGNAGNDFGGAVSAVGGTTALRDANALDVALHTGAATLDAASLSASGTASSLLATTTGALASSVGTTGDVTYHAGGALVFGTSSIGGNLNATAAGPISQTGALDVTGSTTVDAGSNGIDLSTGANLFRSPMVVSGGTTVIASDHGKLAVTLATGDTQLSADEIEVSGSMALTNATSSIRSPNAIPLGNLSITGSGSLEIISGAVMGSSDVSNVSVQNASGLPNKLAIYGASIYQQAGARILTGPNVTLLLIANGKGSIDLSADASVAMSDPSRSTTRLGDLLSVFSKATGANRTLMHDGTNQIQGGISAITKADESQGTNQPKTIVAIASDTITVAPGSIDPVTSVRKPSINSDSVMLIARAINGGGGKIQTHVAATAFGDGRNIATGPTRSEDKDYAILPSIFVISEPNTSGYSFGTLDVPISVSFGAVAGQTSNSLLQTIAVDPFNKEGSSGQVPVYLGTNLQPGEDAVGPIKRYLVFPIDIPKNVIRAVVVNGVKIEDSSAYDAVQTAVAEILNQVRKEQLESGFSNENVAAQLRKGVITETRVGQAAVDRFQGVAPSQRCVGMMVGEMVVCAPAAGPAQ